MITTLSIKKENCIAIVSNKNENKSIIIKRLNSLNINNIIFLENYSPSYENLSNYKKISSEEDILRLKFKLNFSNDMIYDQLCRLQRNSFVDIRDKDFSKTLNNFENIILTANNIIKNFGIQTLITSHNFGVYYGSLTHAAVNNLKFLL